MKLKITALALLLAVLAICQTNHTVAGSRHIYWVGRVPGSPTVIVAGDVLLVHASVATGSTSATITLSDRGMDCSGGPCYFANGVLVPANTTYEIPVGESLAPGGLSFSSTGTLDSHIHYVTKPAP